MSAITQALRGLLKLEAERAARREKARSLIENNDINGIAALVLASEQRDAAATPAGAVTIKETFERRYPGERYSIGPCTPIMSDDFIALEFEPTPGERIAIQEEIKEAQRAMEWMPNPEYVENILKGVPNGT